MESSSPSSATRHLWLLHRDVPPREEPAYVPARITAHFLKRSNLHAAAYLSARRARISFTGNFFAHPSRAPRPRDRPRYVSSFDSRKRRKNARAYIYIYTRGRLRVSIDSRNFSEIVGKNRTTHYFSSVAGILSASADTALRVTSLCELEILYFWLYHEALSLALEAKRSRHHQTSMCRWNSWFSSVRGSDDRERRIVRILRGVKSFINRKSIRRHFFAGDYSSPGYTLYSNNSNFDTRARRSDNKQQAYALWCKLTGPQAFTWNYSPRDFLINGSTRLDLWP